MPTNSNTIKGFTIAGADQKFVWADAKIISENQVEVSSSSIMKPVAVRYAWSDMPTANLYDRNSLPLACFRTDTWPIPSEGKIKAQYRYKFNHSKK